MKTSETNITVKIKISRGENLNNAMTTVKFINGTRRYAVYYGSIDVIDNQTYPTKEDAWNNSREFLLEPKCNHDIKHVELYADYGNGIMWDGKCCSKCGWMIGGVDPYYEEDDTIEI